MTPCSIWNWTRVVWIRARVVDETTCCFVGATKHRIHAVASHSLCVAGSPLVGGNKVIGRAFVNPDCTVRVGAQNSVSNPSEIGDTAVGY